MSMRDRIKARKNVINDVPDEIKQEVKKSKKVKEKKEKKVLKDTDILTEVTKDKLLINE